MFYIGDPLAKSAGAKGGTRRAETISPTRARRLAKKAAAARWSDPKQVEAHRARMLAQAAELRARGLVR